MEQIYRHAEDIVTLAEAQEGFYEVEVTVYIRRNQGADSDFIRLQLENLDGDSRQLTMKKSRSNVGSWF
ncbi:hypothetical protein P5704_012505 [Pseudomonas sp. FeN3W]|jgi:hypothetical protein|uniref:hypothetical protein n=1 Tax=Stutzerimonas nitrititolerans TaxID=2482751 RepID=UPI002561A5C9|nr:hypothetical protein [Stutzerimonas nitrititolerans]WOF76903.1 hypothetical protein P5704_012505 [Pseudomonas sp. FeN3W]